MVSMEMSGGDNLVAGNAMAVVSHWMPGGGRNQAGRIGRLTGFVHVHRSVVGCRKIVEYVEITTLTQRAFDSARACMHYPTNKEVAECEVGCGVHGARHWQIL